MPYNLSFYDMTNILYQIPNTGTALNKVNNN